MDRVPAVLAMGLGGQALGYPSPSPPPSSSPPPPPHHNPHPHPNSNPNPSPNPDLKPNPKPNPNQAMGGAMADLAFGAACPCGKLAETLPHKLDGAEHPHFASHPRQAGCRDKP